MSRFLENTMEDGFYWLYREDMKPIVVEIYCGDMYQCGNEVTCSFNDVIAIIGPMVPPSPGNPLP